MTGISIRLRRAALVAGVASALTAGVAGVATASTPANGVHLGPGHEGSVPSWFFGHTKVCIRNTEAAGGSNIGYLWWSSTSNGSGGLLPGQEDCLYRSFAGFRVGVKNNTPAGSLVVYEPDGPA